jgi:hypothetical protein
MTVTSIVTPQTNGAAPPVANVSKVGKVGKAIAKLTGNTADVKMTAAQACEAAFEYGSSMAGMDGTLTLAYKTFKDNESVLKDIDHSLAVGYMVRKMGYERSRALEVVGLLSYNEKKQDDHHRTFEQERVMGSVRVLIHRARKLAGIIKPKSEAQIKAEETRAAKEAEKKELESRLTKADEIVNPPADTDPFDALARLVLTLKSLQNKYSDKLIGDRGTAWRDWLAAAPK